MSPAFPARISANKANAQRSTGPLTFSFLREPAALKLIGQYESRLSCDFARTLAQLRQVQKLRAIEEAQKLREQTHSSLPLDTERSAASDRGVGGADTHNPTHAEPASLMKEFGEQTQSATSRNPSGPASPMQDNSTGSANPRRQDSL
jgi:hypothetical protein